SARNLTRSTLAVLREELGRARRLRGEDRLQPVAPFAPGAHGAWLVLEVEAASPADRRACLGWVRGGFLGLLLGLERDPRASGRPYPRVQEGPGDGSVARLVLGLGAEGDPARAREAGAAFAEAFAAWGERPEASALRAVLVERAAP